MHITVRLISHDARSIFHMFILKYILRICMSYIQYYNDLYRSVRICAMLFHAPCCMPTDVNFVYRVAPQHLTLGFAAAQLARCLCSRMFHLDRSDYVNHTKQHAVCNQPPDNNDNWEAFEM